MGRGDRVHKPGGHARVNTAQYAEPMEYHKTPAPFSPRFLHMQVSGDSPLGAPAPQPGSRLPAAE